MPAQHNNFLKSDITMIIGVPKEIKNNENRVAVTPAGVREMVAAGNSCGGRNS